MPRFGRRDDNERAIVKALEQVGASVHRLFDGFGLPDLLVGFRRQMFILEVKKARGPRGGSGGKLTKAQVDFRRTWRGPEPITVRTVGEALTAIGIKLAFDPPLLTYEPLKNTRRRNPR